VGLDQIAVDMRAQIDESVEKNHKTLDALGADYLPTADEMRDAVKRQIWKVVTSEEKVPAHVMVKAIETATKLAAMEKGEAPAEQEQVSIFEQLDSLPPDRAAVLLRGEIGRLEALLDNYRYRLEQLG
jgi:hypothetical protein